MPKASMWGACTDIKVLSGEEAYRKRPAFYHAEVKGVLGIDDLPDEFLESVCLAMVKEFPGAFNQETEEFIKRLYQEWLAEKSES